MKFHQPFASPLLFQKHSISHAAAAKSLQSCPTLCDPIDGSPPSSPIPGILQARTLEWVAISFSNAWKWKVKGKSLNHVWLLATPWTAANQAPPSMGLFRQEYWSGLPFPSPCFPGFLVWKLKLWIWDLYYFFLTFSNAINFPLKIALAASNQFGYFTF